MTVSETDQDDAERPSPKPRSEPVPDPGAGRGWKPVLSALIAAVVFFVAAVTFGVLWFVERHAESERDAALAAAKVYAVDLTTYHHGRIDENFEKVTSNSTEKFAKMYREVSKQLTDLLKKYRADSRGELLHAGVAEFSGDKAVVVLIIDTTITNTNSPQPRIDRNRMVMTVLEVDGQWKLDEVALT